MRHLSAFRGTLTGPIAALALFIAGGAWPFDAAAETSGTAYTTILPKDCHKVRGIKTGNDEIASDVACNGFADLTVLRQMDDDRETISVGRSAKAAAAEPASSQGFAPFNSTGDTIEWRLDKSGKPFAIIQRWRISDNRNVGTDGRPRSVAMLVVTRLAPGPVCHVAYIDVAANPKANEIARRAADEWARDFDCAKGAIRIRGQRGRSIELTLPRIKPRMRAKTVPLILMPALQTPVSRKQALPLRRDAPRRAYGLRNGLAPGMG
ncbi:MAG: hypothetical protein JSS22_08220 [Proteobacteria bacterium]|nr:hypothetical protein [Pseudomonadota bacterium]